MHVFIHNSYNFIVLTKDRTVATEEDAIQLQHDLDHLG